MLRASSLVLICVLATTQLEAGQCSLDWACVEIEERDAVISLFARNKKPYPITLTVAVSPVGQVGGNRDPITVSVPGFSRTPVTELQRSAQGRELDYRYRYDWTVGWLNPDHNDEYLYRLPYGEDVSYAILQSYGSKFSHTGLEHFTVDFRMPVNTPVHAAREGVVAMIEERHDRGCWGKGCGAFANYVVVLHDDGTTGEYYHLAKGGALVNPGERVERGQQIGLSGNTGNTTIPHLHFGVYRAADWGRTQSIAVRFATREGTVSRPRPGAYYLNDKGRRASLARVSRD